MRRVGSHVARAGRSPSDLVGAVIFIHVPKTGGTSIRQAFGVGGLRAVCDCPRGHAARHYPARCVRETIGRAAWDSALTFSVARNPFDRLVSGFHHEVDHGVTSIHDFEPWLLNYVGADGARLLRSYPSHWRMLSDGERLIVDHVLDFEEYRRDWGIVGRLLGCEASPKYAHRSTRGPWQSYYDSGLAGLVTEHYAEDFEHFRDLLPDSEPWPVYPQEED